MIRENFNDLYAFVIVAQEKSFTRAAAKLGVSQSALSQTIRALENRLDMRLLSRTTRSVSATVAGERLYNSLQLHFSDIEDELSELTTLKDKPAGKIRITTGEHAVENVIWSKLTDFLRQYPDIKVEIHVDNGMVDIVEGRYDAGIRLGEQVEKDMIAVRIGPDMRMAVVATPEYFSGREKPGHPKDIVRHRCFNFFLPTQGSNMIWEFEKDGLSVNVRPEGQMTFNTIPLLIKAALSGLGLAYMPEDLAECYLKDGQLVRVLEDWCPPFEGLYLYYPSRHQPLQAFKLLVEALRYREE